MNRLYSPVLFSLLASTVVVGGCSAEANAPNEPAAVGTKDSTPAGTSVVTSQVTREAAPAVSATDADELRDGNTAFAADLYRELSAGAGNLFFSPHSISMALAMTYAGARTTTESQIATALHYTLPQDRLHPALNKLDLELASRANPSGSGNDGKGFRLNVVNSMWGAPAVPFQATFLDTLAKNYGAGVRVTDFQQDPEAARAAINSWVDTATETKIKDLLPKGSITDGTRLVLVNAIYFNAAWQQAFALGATKAATFHSSTGDQVVSMMSRSLETRYASDVGWRAVTIPYEGGKLSFVAVLPDDITAFSAALDGAKLASIANAGSRVDVDLQLPKFKIEGESTSLKEVLAARGMTDAFSDQTADFSGITGDRSLAISDIVHKAFVSVDEAGTEAAASTAVVAGVTSVPVKVEQIAFNKPFVFFIRDELTGAILFLGRVTRV